MKGLLRTVPIDKFHKRRCVNFRVLSKRESKNSSFSELGEIKSNPTTAARSVTRMIGFVAPNVLHITISFKFHLNRFASRTPRNTFPLSKDKKPCGRAIGFTSTLDRGFWLSFYLGTSRDPY